MKKALSLVLMILVGFAFAACGDDNGGEETCADKGMNGADGDACDATCGCDTGLECTGGTCQAGGDDCCPDEDDLWITVDGMAMSFQMSGVPAALAALSPLPALGGDFTPIAEATAGADGAFSFGCFDVANVSLGLVILADDTIPPDGDAGNFIPTISGVASFGDNSDKVCLEGAQAMVMDTGTNAGLAAAGADLAGTGYIVGLVLDANRDPIGGATVQKGDGSSAGTVLYPNADFSGMGAATDPAHGAFVITTELSLSPLVGVLTDFTWDDTTYRAATIPGAVYFVPVIANEAQ